MGEPRFCNQVLGGFSFACHCFRSVGGMMFPKAMQLQSALT